MLGKIICLFKGHYYGISYEQRWTERSRNKRSRSRFRHNIRSRFTCDRCGHKTKWLGRKQSNLIIESERFGYR